MLIKAIKIRNGTNKNYEARPKEVAKFIEIMKLKNYKVQKLLV